jgi:hypothetical protein
VIVLEMARVNDIFVEGLFGMAKDVKGCVKLDMLLIRQPSWNISHYERPIYERTLNMDF